MKKPFVYFFFLVVYGAFLVPMVSLQSLSSTFDVCMDSAQYHTLLSNEAQQSIYHFFKRQFTQSEEPQYNVSTEIPRIIHHIWLGSPFPSGYEEWYQTWRSFHPQWSTVFWTDREENYDKGAVVVYSFDELKEQLKQNVPVHIVVDIRFLVLVNQEAFDEAVNYGERSDILRFEVLEHIGGLYVDTDFECLRSFDILQKSYECYTGLQPLDTGCVQLGSALISSIPHHPFIKRCVETVPANRDKKRIIERTGPLFFTYCFVCSCIDNPRINLIAFPAHYFYPCSYHEVGLPKNFWLKKHAYAVHHWEGSWLS
ncbi:MAG: glycosyltransferase [Candidatus Babeliales bacterium]